MLRALIVLLFLPATPFFCHAAIVVDVTQTSGGVSFEGGGTLDFTSATQGVGSSAPAGVDFDFYVLVGPPTAQAFDVHFPTGFSGPGSVGTGNFEKSTGGLGDLFGVSWGRRSLAVPIDYQSGDPLVGSMEIANETIASAGLTPGVYVWSWETATGMDSFTVNIAPEPSTSVLLLCLASAGLVRRRGRFSRR